MAFSYYIYNRQSNVFISNGCLEVHSISNVLDWMELHRWRLESVSSFAHSTCASYLFLCLQEPFLSNMVNFSMWANVNKFDKSKNGILSIDKQFISFKTEHNSKFTQNLIVKRWQHPFQNDCLQQAKLVVLLDSFCELVFDWEYKRCGFVYGEKCSWTRFFR